PKLFCAVVRNLSDRLLTFVWDDTALALGRAAIRHENVRRAIFELWSKGECSNSPMIISINRSEFPGRALEELILRGDVEALRIYTEWLKHTNHGLPFHSYASPLFDNMNPPPELQTSARDLAASIWLYATEGRLDEQGKSIRLDSGVAGAALYRLSSFWATDRELCSQIERWLESDDFHQFYAALLALQRVPLSATKRRKIADRLRDLLVKEENEWFMGFRWWSMLNLIERAGFSRDIEPLLEALAQADSNFWALQRKSLDAVRSCAAGKDATRCRQRLGACSRGIAVGP
ncbi:MAG: hypothetical protein L6Q76_10940, partial [Polyangiaceae bacterium]|nr:hypothetical protein [Polyangiaceae bacterium]